MKIPSSDTIYYISWYANVDRLNPVHSFLYYRGVYSLIEPCFVLISLLFNYVALGDVKCYLFLCTVFIYVLQSISIYQVSKVVHAPNTIIVLLIILLAFYNPLFIQSVHALRQMLATSIFMFAISRRVVTGKNSWWLILSSLLTHTSVIVFIPIILIPLAFEKLTFKRIFLIFSLSLFFLVGYSSIGTFLQGSSFEYLSYVGDKIVTSADHNQMNLDLKGFYLYNIPFLSLTLFSLLNIKKTSGLITVYYILYFVTFFVIVTNLISSEVSVRYSMFICSFFPYCLLAFAMSCRKYSQVILQFMAIAFVLYFCYLLLGDTSYDSVPYNLLKPFPIIF